MELLLFFYIRKATHVRYIWCKTDAGLTYIYIFIPSQGKSVGKHRCAQIWIFIFVILRIFLKLLFVLLALFKLNFLKTTRYGKSNCQNMWVQSTSYRISWLESILFLLLCIALMITKGTVLFTEQSFTVSCWSTSPITKSLWPLLDLCPKLIIQYIWS